MNWLEVIFLSFIEGLTEFLPISSTGHLIISSALFGIQEEGFVKSFNIIIQFGAILSVLTIYHQRFRAEMKNDYSFYKKLFVAFLPAAVVGLAVKSKIDSLLGDVKIVGYALLIGGVILIASDFFFKPQRQTKKLNDLTIPQFLILGLTQCFAFIPGVSRSAATIIGGLSLRLEKKEATEFSFFLAVPTLTAAAGYKTLGIIRTIDAQQSLYLLAGLALSYVFALMAIKMFIQIVSKFGFTAFGIYRILAGGLVLYLFWGN